MTTPPARVCSWPEPIRPSCWKHHRRWSPRHATATAVVVAGGGGGRRDGGLVLACGLRSATRFFLLDEVAQLGLGIGLGLFELGGRLLGLFLLGDEAVGELTGLLALAGQGVTIVVEVGHERVELVAGDVAGAQRHPGQFVALEYIAQVARVFEERAERRRATADERPQRHLAEAPAELFEFGFLGGDRGLGIGDLGVELGLGVDRFDVVLGELVRLLLEAVEFVDDVGDLLPLPVDRLRRRDGGRQCGDEERDHQGDREHAEKLLHKNLAQPSEYDECVAKV